MRLLPLAVLLSFPTFGFAQSYACQPTKSCDFPTMECRDMVDAGTMFINFTPDVITIETPIGAPDRLEVLAIHKSASLTTYFTQENDDPVMFSITSDGALAIAGTVAFDALTVLVSANCEASQ